MSKKKKPARSVAQRLRDQVQIADFYLRGKSQAYIGERMGLSQPTISRDIEAIRERWLASSLQAFDARKAEELAKLDKVESNAWEAWERSRQPLREQKQVLKAYKDGKGRPKKNPDPTDILDLTRLPKAVEQTTVEKEVIGDPRYLQIVLSCIDQRSRILGINAPTKIAPTTPDGEEEWTGLTDDELEQKSITILNRYIEYSEN